LVAHTDAILSRLELASAEVASLSGPPRGTVRIASFQTATHALVLPVLAELNKHEHLTVQLSVVEPESALPSLLSRDFDIVIGEVYPGSPPRLSRTLNTLTSVLIHCGSRSPTRSGYPTYAMPVMRSGSWNHGAPAPGCGQPTSVGTLASSQTWVRVG